MLDLYVCGLAVPDFAESGVFAEVVDVPVQPFASVVLSLMPAQTAVETARTIDTSHIEIPARRRRVPGVLSIECDICPLRQIEDEDVDARRKGYRTHGGPLIDRPTRLESAGRERWARPLGEPRFAFEMWSLYAAARGQLWRTSPSIRPSNTSFDPA